MISKFTTFFTTNYNTAYFLQTDQLGKNFLGYKKTLFKLTMNLAFKLSSNVFSYVYKLFMSS